MLIIKRNFKYRKLGGHLFYKERELDIDTVVDKAIFEDNWACINFMNRRPDYDCNFPYKLYYGHVDDGLGYIIAEDELEEISDDEYIDLESSQLPPKNIKSWFYKIFHRSK